MAQSLQETSREERYGTEGESEGSRRKGRKNKKSVGLQKLDGGIARKGAGSRRVREKERKKRHAARRGVSERGWDREQDEKDIRQG